MYVGSLKREKIRNIRGLFNEFQGFRVLGFRFRVLGL